jgi:hypothetical protein
VIRRENERKTLLGRQGLDMISNSKNNRLFDSWGILLPWIGL